MPDKIKVAVIGGGPGGYAAAFLAADLGLDVTLIDKEKNPGGVCLYRGCIPSKALLHAARVINESKEAKNFGIEFGDPKIDLDKLRDWKNDVVGKLTGGLGVLSKQRKINFVRGTASFLNSKTIHIEKHEGGTEEIKVDKTIIATGSVPTKIPGIPYDSERVMDSTAGLNIEDIPKKLLVIGGGYIGLELTTVYAALGSKVTVVEMLPQLLTGADKDMVKILAKSIGKMTEAVLLETKAAKVEEVKAGLKVTFEGKEKDGESEVFDKILISVGRKPVTDGFGLENTKVKVNKKGFIEINERQETADPDILAIGDVAGDPMLAHKATAEGRVAAEIIAGEKSAFEPNAIPAVVFTDPELAWAGLTELEAKEKGIDVEVVRFPWGASGRATTIDRGDGLTKLLIDPETQRVLGMGIVGVGAGEMIAEGVLAVEMAALAKDVALSIHPHPTLSETVMESAEMFFGHATHIYKPKRK